MFQHQPLEKGKMVKTEYLTVINPIGLLFYSIYGIYGGGLIISW